MNGNAVELLVAAGILMMLVSNVCFGAGIPDKVSIGSIQKYYAPVSFNHAAHINKLKDCGLCHHHTTGAQVTDPNCARCHKNSGAQAVVSCKGCHVADPFTPEALKQQRDQQPAQHRERPSPPVQAGHVRGAPEAAALPQLRPAINGGEHSAERADAAAADKIDLDAGVLQRAPCRGFGF